MNDRTRRIGLTAVLMLMGGLLIAGSVISMIATGLFPLDQALGVHASVAGAALGVGLCAAAWDPVNNVTWVRIAIVYSILVVVYQFLALIVLHVPLSVGPLLFGILAAIALIVLYPFRSQLLPPHEHSTLTTSSSGRAGARV